MKTFEKAPESADGAEVIERAGLQSEDAERLQTVERDNGKE